MALYRQAGSSYRTRDKDGLTRAYRAVLMVLKKAANDKGTACLTNGELAAKAEVSRRSVQAATAYLAEQGFILKIERRRTREYSDPNIYRLAPGKNFSRQGRKNRTQNPRKGLNNLHTYSSTPSGSERSCNPALKRAETGERARRPTATYRAPKTPALPRFDREQIVTALKRLGVELGNDVALTDGQLLDHIDTLRRDRIPGFAAMAWGYRATVHGLQAWYAILETVGMLDGLIPQKDGGIRDAAAYLGGILWKDQTDPRKTVLDWLEIEARRESESRNEKVRADYAARQSVHDELLARVIEDLVGVLGPNDVATWIKPAKILAVADERVTLAFPSRFLKEWAMQHHRKPITAAFARVRRQATAVVFTVRNGL